MDISLSTTAERISLDEASDNFVFQRSKLAYCKAAEFISGEVLEIGTGDGYGISYILPFAKHFTTVDKNNKPLRISIDQHFSLHVMKVKVPSLENFPDQSFETVIIFQVIEHIQDDVKMIEEISRVLKPHGKLIISTPNKNMSLTRNPWHVREYTEEEFTVLLQKYFTEVNRYGVFGNEKVMGYYGKNKKSVENITRFDILNFQHWLPRWMLRIPYDILNRINRRKLLLKDPRLTMSIEMNDYYIKPIYRNEEECFDLFYVATKV